MSSKRPRESDAVPENSSIRLSEEAWISGSFVEDKQSKLEGRFCPLCFNRCVEHPVRLHAIELHGTATPMQCLACRECVNAFQHIGAVNSSFQCPFCEAGINTSNLNSLNNVKSEETQNCLNPSSDCVLSSSEETNSICGACEDRHAKSYCVQCGFELCAECISTMHAKKCFQHHSVVSLQEAKSLPQRCGTHAEHHLDLFCRDCQSLGCVLCCFSGAHKGHKVSPVSDVAKEILQRIKDAVRSANSIGDTAASKREQLKECVKVVESAHHHNRQLVVDGFAELRDIIQRREKELLQSLDDAAKPTMSALQKCTSQCSGIELYCRKEAECWSRLVQADKLALVRLLSSLEKSMDTAQRLTSESLVEISHKVKEVQGIIGNDRDVENFLGRFTMKRSSQTMEEYHAMWNTVRHIGEVHLNNKEVCASHGASSAGARSRAPNASTSIKKDHLISQSSTAVSSLQIETKENTVTANVLPSSTFWSPSNPPHRAPSINFSSSLGGESSALRERGGSMPLASKPLNTLKPQSLTVKGTTQKRYASLDRVFQ